MSSTAKLGAFMLAALAVLGFFVLRIERIRLGGAASRQTVQAQFPSVAGLNEKGPVRIAGVRVGLVEKIGLSGDAALVTLDLDRDVKLREGAHATVRSLGLLGEQYVEIDPGPPGAPPLAPGTVLAGATPTGMDQLFDTAGGVGGDLKAITASVRASIGGPEGERRLQQILANVEALTESLHAMAAENRGQVAASMENIRAVTATLREELPKLAQRLESLVGGLDSMVAENRENVSGSLEHVRELSESLRLSARNLNDITGKIARGEGSIGKLINDPTTVDNLNTTLKSVEGGVASLQETIGRARRWRLDVDMNAENQFKIDDSRFEVDANLATTERRFFRLGLVRPPYGNEQITRETTTTTADGSPPTTVVVDKVKETDKFVFNAQVGYRRRWDFGQTDLRAGLIESWGGIGIDQTLWKDRIGLTLEAFNFGRDNDGAHVRFVGKFFVTPNLYAYGGYNDPLSDRYGGGVLGVGVRWNDEDAKYLLGSAGSLVRP